MSTLVLVLLGGVWAWILLPDALRARREASPVRSVDSFERSMGMLARHLGETALRPARSLPGRQVLVLRDPASVTGARTRNRAVRRRRAVLVRLLAASLLTAVPALVVGGSLWWLFGVSAAALAGYVLLLLEYRARELEVRRKVRRLPRRPPVAAPGPVGRLPQRPPVVAPAGVGRLPQRPPVAAPMAGAMSQPGSASPARRPASGWS